MMPERDPDVLLARLARLERRLAGITRILAVAAGILILLVVGALASNRGVVVAQGRAAAEIVASSIKLVDATGRPRAALYVDGQSAGLAISDPAGQTRVLLSTDGASTKLAFIGASKGFPRVLLAQEDDVQMLTLEDAKASHIALMHAGATPSLVVSSGESSAEVAIAESFTGGRATPALIPTLTLKQGSRTLATLPATPAR
jgi:hypothetical protein